MLLVPGVNDRLRVLVEESDEDTVAGGKIYMSTLLGDVYVAEYEYTEGTWFGCIYSADVSPRDIAENVREYDEAISRGDYGAAIACVNEYQAGEYDNLGTLREGEYDIWAGELGFDHTQLAVETMLIDKVRKYLE